MKKYFRHAAESDLGEGVAYMEIIDDWPTRQIEIYGDTWRWADEEHNHWLADQPLEVLGLTRDDEVPQDEFEAKWQEALKRCPPPL